MDLKKYLVFLILISSCLSALAQDKKAKEAYSSQYDFARQLEITRQLRFSQPEKAIKLLEDVLREGKRNSNRVIKAEAYLLLGNIYEDIGQNTLALQRYQQATALLVKSNQPELQALNYYHTGKTQLALSKLEVARHSLDNCLAITKDAKLELKCQECLADLAMASGDFLEALTLYDHLINNKNHLDSLAIARIEAKKSQIFIRQNDRAKAEQSYFNSLNSVPQQTLSKKDFEDIDKANKALSEDVNQEEVDKIAFKLNTIQTQQKNQLPPEALIKEQLQLADLYANRGDLNTATKYVNASKGLLKVKVMPDEKAAVFKKSSELNRLRGDYQKALADYERYVAENELVIKAKQANLNRQISILENQKNIDLLEKDFVLEEKEEALLKNQIQTQQILIGFLTLLLLAALTSFYFIMKNVKAKRKANQLLYLKSLRTQMNPHFIFNALNSVNNFIAKNDERAANKFLSDFSRLMRMVLDHSQKDFITFEEELQLNELYLKLEQLRFRDKFDYVIEKDPLLHAADLEVPPMLIQPFIENAIWHGLRYKKDRGYLKFSIKQEPKALLITIQDDGIGRTKSQALKTKNQQKYKSTGLQNVGERIALINRIYAKNYEINVSDFKPAKEDTGTLVEIRVPI